LAKRALSSYKVTDAEIEATRIEILELLEDWARRNHKKKEANKAW
jgi:hypothetical protein